MRKKYSWMLLVTLGMTIFACMASNRILPLGKSDPTTPNPYLNCAPDQNAPFASKTVRILSQDFQAVRDDLFQNPEVEDLWKQKNAWSLSRDGYGWVVDLYLTPAIPIQPSHPVANPVRLSPDQDVIGKLILANYWKRPKSIRFLFMLDYQQLWVEQQGQPSAFFEFPEVEDDGNVGLIFNLGKLRRGFHQFSLLIVDRPEPGSVSLTIEEIIQQASAGEFRFDLWVGIDQLPDHAMSLYQQGFRQETPVRINHLEFMQGLQTADSPKIIEQLAIKNSDHPQVRLALFTCEQNCIPGNQANLPGEPVRISLLIDDRQTQALNCTVGSNLPRFLDLPVNLDPATLSNGSHLRVVLFSNPGYSQFDPSTLEFILDSRPVFSRVIPLQ